MISITTLHTSLPLTTIPYGVVLGVTAGVVLGVDVKNGVGHSIKKVHFVSVRGAKTINLDWSGNGLDFKNEPVPYPIPVTGGNPLSIKS